MAPISFGPATWALRCSAYAYALLVLLLICLAPPVLAESCPGISPETAQRLLERVQQVSVGSGYSLEGVGTRGSELSVLWSLNGTPCPPIRVDVENCASPRQVATLQLHVPAELAARCPGLQAVVKELSSAVPTEHPVGLPMSLPASAVPALIAISALVLVAGLLIRHLLAPTAGKGIGWGDIGWIACTVAAATPFIFNAPRAVTAELGVAWVVFAILLYDRQRLAAESRAQKLGLLGLFLFSLLLHWSLSSGGPGDLQLNLGGIWSSSFALELRWGPAPIAFFRLLALLLGGIRDTDILWCNLIVSSLLPVLLYGIVSELGVGKPAALLAAFVVAAHPLLIAFSGVLERQPLYLFAASGSTLALIAFLKRGGWGRFIAFVIGAVLATTSRPEGAHVLILHLAVLLLVPATRRARGVAALALALLFSLAFAYIRFVLGGSGHFHYLLGTNGESLSGGKSFAGQFPLLWTILFSPDFTPLAWIVAWTLGLILGVRRRAAWITVVTLLGLDIAWRWTAMYRMFVGHERQVASARYESILLVPFVIGVALFIQALPKASPWLKASIVAACIGLTAATYRRPYETLVRPFTIDYEYQFLKKYALTLPPRSRLYILDSPLSDIGFLDAPLVGQFVGSAVSFEAWRDRQCDDLLRDASRTYLYIGSSCAELVDNDPDSPLSSTDYASWMRDCAAIRNHVRGDPVEEIDVPAHKMAWHDFRDSTVRLALYRLKDPSICAVGPRLRSERE